MSVLGVTRAVGTGTVSWRRLRAPSTARPGVLVAHGAGVTSTAYLNTGNREIPERLAQRGYVGLASDLSGAPGGTDPWGNDALRGATPASGSGYTALFTLSLGGAALPADGYGFSQGGLNLLNIGRMNPTLIRRLVLDHPVLDLADVHDNDRGALGLAASIETAYGGAGGYAAAVAAHNPNDAAFRAAIVAAGWRIRVYYATDDPICLPAITTAWCAAVGAEAVSVGATGHAPSGTKAEQICDWLWAA